MARRPAGIFRWRARAGLVLLLLGVGLLDSTSVASSDNTPERLVVVGDVHGDFDDLCRILKRAGLVDDQNRWIGGTATLVQTGDLVDRGPKGREAMDLLMGLEKEAAKAGGQVVPLLGNHEVMNILGDLRYVTPQGYAVFADNESEKRRKAAYQEYAVWCASHAKLLAELKQPTLPATEEEWMARHPVGFLEYREAFSANGDYGKWVRHHAAVVKIAGVIFLHGGIHPNLASLQLEQINSQIQEEIEEFDKTKQELVSRNVILPFFTIQEIVVAVQGELLAERAAETPPDAENRDRLVRLLDFNSWLCMRDDGPLWFRGYDQWNEEEGAPQIGRILAAYDAAHIVVGHTVQKAAHIRRRFEGKVFLIDTGMLSTYWPGGRPSALEIRAGKFTAQYLDGAEVLFEERPPASVGKGNGTSFRIMPASKGWLR
ncbi:MAG: metallophosphoesterase [Acidobacteriia bacterium]|nr:metallophosphoesterase [Terriglobia bacterium]